MIPTEFGWAFVDNYVKKEIFLAKGIALNETEFVLENGNLYFKRSLLELICEQFPELSSISRDHSSIAVGQYSPKLSYRVHIKFDTIIPDDSDETRRLALAQATSYVLMDYFNQYYHAVTTANMISEIG